MGRGWAAARGVAAASARFKLSGLTTFEVDLARSRRVELDLHLVAPVRDFGHQDVAAIQFLSWCRFDRFQPQSPFGDGLPNKHVIAAGLLLNGEAPDRDQGRAEGFGLRLQGGLCVRFLARGAPPGAALRRSPPRPCPGERRKIPA